LIPPVSPAEFQTNLPGRPFNEVQDRLVTLATQVESLFASFKRCQFAHERSCNIRIDLAVEQDRPFG